MKHTSIKGQVRQVKIIKAKPILVYMKLESITDSKIIHALIAKHPLQFMLDIAEEDIIVIYGYYNTRNQFIVEKYLIQEKKHALINHPAHLQYPKKQSSK